jgi:hypothetical protein
MPRPPFRLLDPAQFALLSAQEKSDYLGRLAVDVQEHLRESRERNGRMVEWLLHKDDARGRK